MGLQTYLGFGLERMCNRTWGMDLQTYLGFVWATLASGVSVVSPKDDPLNQESFVLVHAG